MYIYIRKFNINRMLLVHSPYSNFVHSPSNVLSSSFPLVQYQVILRFLIVLRCYVCVVSNS